MLLNPRIACAALAAGTFLFAACGSEGRAPQASAPQTVAPADAQWSTPLEIDTSYQLVMEFRGYANPRQGILQVEMAEQRLNVQPGLNGLRTNEQAQWCALIIDNSGGGFPESVRIFTVPDTVFEDGECASDPITAAIYDSTGAFCGNQTIINQYATTFLTDVHAQIFTMAPPTGFRGLRFPNGTGAEPRPGLSDEYGLWAYGDLAPGQQNTVQWIFERGDGDFYFLGRVYAAFQEVCNGLDDNCNGTIDEGAGCFPDGDPCNTAADCQTGICAGGTCGVSSFELRGVVGTGGGGTMTSGTRRMTIRIGAPQPMGEANGPNFGIRLGPLSDF